MWLVYCEILSNWKNLVRFYYWYVNNVAIEEMLSQEFLYSDKSKKLML
jgi:hypothetical protein